MFSKYGAVKLWDTELSEIKHGEAPKRDEIEDEYKWNLKDIYENDALWEKDFSIVDGKIADYKKYEGKMTKAPETLYSALKFDDEIGTILNRLYLYAMLSKDADLTDTKYMAYDERVKSLLAKVTAANAFYHPEILSVSLGHIRKMYASEPGLKQYDHYFEDLFRQAEHTLNKEQEEIIALASEVRNVPYTAYNLLTNADIEYPVIKDEKGEDQRISQPKFYAALYSVDRQYRQRAYKGYYSQYKKYANTCSALLNGSIKSNIFNTKARKYGSAMEASLSKNNIPVSVYNSLIAAASENLEPMHRWTRLKKKLLGVEELHPYDSYVSLFNIEKEYSFETGKKLMIESLECLGGEYLELLNTAFDNRWLDVYETRNKRTGAYSSGATVGVHPYVLLNWTNMLNDVFTLTHEMGHNMHSYYTSTSQPYIYASYSIFLAEIASTFNENLLLDYLITYARSNYEKLALLEKYLNNITTTFFRQTMFAEFEKIVHEKTESGEGLTPADFKLIYRQLYQKYWGPDMIVDEEEEFTWARIPHFYYNFYVFQYATGFAASEALVQGIKNSGKPAVDKYLNFLKAGSSDFPIGLLKNTGVDMTTKEPFTAVIKKMNECLDEIESLI
jgi:oligoendopeptidase F